MSLRALKLAIVLTGVLMVALQVRAKSAPTRDEINGRARGFAGGEDWRGRVAPDFELTTLDGSTFRMSDVIGKKVVILNFFTTWCGPCRAEMPELAAFQRTHASEAVVLVGVDVREKDEVVKEYVRSLGLTFPIGVDGAGDIGDQYEVEAFPTTVVIGADGRVKQYETGAIANADVALGSVVDAQIADLRAGRGITTAAYKEAVAAEATRGDRHNEDATLTGRAKQIADAMPCPCGCSDRVTSCGCNTSKGIKARLAKGGYDDKTDVEVMQELNKEFCMKSM
jgi:thiol-disulfide isomerase/thioredoxin